MLRMSCASRPMHRRVEMSKTSKFEAVSTTMTCKRAFVDEQECKGSDSARRTRSLYHRSASTAVSQFHPSISSKSTLAGGGGSGLSAPTGLRFGSGARPPFTPRTRTRRTRRPQDQARMGSSPCASSPAAASFFPSCAAPPAAASSLAFLALGHHATTPWLAHPRSTSSSGAPAPVPPSAASRANWTRHHVRGAGLRPTTTSFVGVSSATSESGSVCGCGAGPSGSGAMSSTTEGFLLPEGVAAREAGCGGCGKPVERGLERGEVGKAGEEGGEATEARGGGVVRAVASGGREEGVEGGGDARAVAGSG